MNVIMELVECYFKGEESNTEKKVKDIKEIASGISESSQQQRKSHYTLPVREKSTSIKVGGPLKTSRPLAFVGEKIWHGLLHTLDIMPPLAPKSDSIGLKLNRWCKYHKVISHHTNGCFQIKRVINQLIQEGHLKKYARGGSKQTRSSFKT